MTGRSFSFVTAGAFALLVTAVGVQAYYLVQLDRQVDTLTAQAAARAAGNAATNLPPAAPVVAAVPAPPPGAGSLSGSLSVPRSAQPPPASGGITFTPQSPPAAPQSVPDPAQQLQRMNEWADQMMRSFLQDDPFLGRGPLGLRFGIPPQPSTQQPATPGTVVAGTLGITVEDAGTEYVARVRVPGAVEGSTSVEVRDNVLTVSGTTDATQVERDASGRVLSQHRSVQSFRQSTTLPGPVRPDGMTSEWKDGELTIRLPKP